MGTSYDYPEGTEMPQKCFYCGLPLGDEDKRSGRCEGYEGCRMPWGPINPSTTAESRGWIPVTTSPPKGEDFGDFFDSIDVLVANERDMYVGYQQAWKDDECKAKWKMKGPDGWNIDGVTYWMPLPALPKL